MEFSNTKKQKLSRQTILWSLYDREINGMKKRKNCIRATYQNVLPNCTILDVRTPLCFLRKFTPDGRHLLAFSEDLTTLEVYDWLGCQMAANLLKNYEEKCIGQFNDDDVCWQLFKTLFQLRYRLKITNEEQLNRECCLFTENGYAVLASSSNILDSRRSQFYQMYSNNEAMSPDILCPLIDYTIYLVHISSGIISHSIQFKCDKIYLSHNQGIYLLKNTLAILSVQHQVIHIYKIIRNRFHSLTKVGRFCFDDDHLLISSVYTNMNLSMYKPFKENTINGLKQKLMIFLYKKAELKSQETGSQYPFKKFYQNFDEYLSLRMWKMQLLGEHHVLIRYSSEEVVTFKIHEPSTQIGLYMIYDLDTTKVLDVFKNTSGELLQIFQRNSDYFRYPLDKPDGIITSSANKIQTWESYKKYNLTKTDRLNIKEANRHMLAPLPIAAQSFTSTPYLDKSLFCFDEEWVSLLDRPKLVGEHPIRFSSRDSGLLSFCLYTKNSDIPEPDDERIVAFTFHPTEPFAISVQRENFEFIINFHIRKVYMPE